MNYANHLRPVRAAINRCSRRRATAKRRRRRSGNVAQPSGARRRCWPGKLYLRSIVVVELVRLASVSCRALRPPPKSTGAQWPGSGQQAIEWASCRVRVADIVSQRRQQRQPRPPARPVTTILSLVFCIRWLLLLSLLPHACNSNCKLTRLDDEVARQSAE